MGKLVKYCFSLFFFLFLISLSPILAQERIMGFDAKMDIRANGTVSVVETIRYDFGTEEKHGIYRSIPYVKVNEEGKEYEMKIEEIQVNDEKGVRHNATYSYEGNDIRLKIGDKDRTLTGEHTYVIIYTLSGALTYFSDHDELYWNVTGNGWDVPIEQASAHVYLPKQIKQGKLTAVCYTGSYGSSTKNCSVEVGGDQVFVRTTEPLAAHEGLTMAVSFPQHLVNVLEPQERVPFFTTVLGKVVIVFLAIISLFWYLFLPIFLVYRWFKSGRDPKPTIHEVSTWFDPPKDTSGRLLTPAETGVLHDESADLRDIQATVIDLARRGYMKIEERKKNDFYLVSKKKADAKLQEFEKTLFLGIFKGKDEVRLKDKKLAETVDATKKELYDLSVENGFFPSNPSTIKTLYTVLGVVGLFTANIFLLIVSLVFGRAMVKRTPDGSDALQVVKSLKNFLSSQERQLAFQAEKQMMFEKLLPYAIVFGVEKIWVERFKDLGLSQPDWYEASYGNTFTTHAFLSSMNSSLSSINSAATPVSSSSGFSSGSSGGFSGGGGGGGGGGSW